MTQPPAVDAVFRPHPEIVSRRLGDTAVLVHLPSNRIFELNSTGARIWELLCAGTSILGIREQLIAEFDVTPAQAAAETDDLVGRLRDEGLLQP